MATESGRAVFVPTVEGVASRLIKQRFSGSLREVFAETVFSGKMQKGRRLRKRGWTARRKSRRGGF